MSSKYNHNDPTTKKGRMAAAPRGSMFTSHLYMRRAGWGGSTDYTSLYGTFADTSLKFQHPDQDVAIGITELLSNSFQMSSRSEGRDFSFANREMLRFFSEKEKVLTEFFQNVRLPNGHELFWYSAGQALEGSSSGTMVNTDDVVDRLSITREERPTMGLDLITVTFPYNEREYGDIYDAAMVVAKKHRFASYTLILGARLDRPPQWRNEAVDVVLQFQHPSREMAMGITEQWHGMSRKDLDMTTYLGRLFNLAVTEMRDARGIDLVYKDVTDVVRGAQSGLRVPMAKVVGVDDISIDFERVMRRGDKTTVVFAFPYDEEEYGNLYSMVQTLVKPARTGDVITACGVCKEARALFQCSQCKAAYYCGEECQEMAFNAHPCC